MSERAIGAVLAGGASRRMGRPKATLALDGEPLGSRAVDIVEAAGLEPVVVAKRDSPLPPLAVRVIAEPDEPRHPLAGIVAVLRETKRPVAVLGCDMPLAPPTLLALLGELVRESGGAAVTEVDGGLEPLLAAYDPGTANALDTALADGLALRDAVASLEPKRIREEELRRFGDPRTVAFNVNSPSDLERAAELLSSRARP